MSERGSDRPRKLTIYTLQKSNIVQNPVCFSWTISATNLRQKIKKDNEQPWRMRSEQVKNTFTTFEWHQKIYMFALFNNTFLLFTINMHLRTHLFRLATHTWWIINNYIRSKCSTLGAFNQTKGYNSLFLFFLFCFLFLLLDC